MALEMRKGDKVYLHKEAGISLELFWAVPKRTGFIRSKDFKVDYGCLYMLEDGRKGCIQDLGKNQGKLNEAPYIRLTKDENGHEKLQILPENMQYVRKLVAFVYFCDSAPKWRDARFHAVASNGTDEDLIINVDDWDPELRMCAIARIKNRDDGTTSVKKVVEFFKDHEALDTEFKWGLRWVDAPKE